MKNVWLYHLIADGPIVLFFAYYYEAGRPLEAFLTFAILYPFIYRPMVDYYRLIALEKIEEGNYREILKFGTIGYRFKYYGDLMFGNR